MTRSLPVKPSLEHLKNEAKAILKAHKSGDESACAVLRHLKKFSPLSDGEILSARVTLQEVQHALAQEYGFRSWNLLRQVAGTDFRQAGKPARRVDVDWGEDYEISSEIRDRIDEVAEFLVRISADIHVNSDPDCTSRNLEGARHYIQRWLDYKFNDERFDEGLRASTLVFERSTGRMVAACLVGGARDSAGIYDWFVDPAHDREDMIRKMTDRALSVLAELGIEELHVWREDDEADAPLIEALGFELTGEVEGGISVDGKGVNVNLKSRLAYDEDGCRWIEGVPEVELGERWDMLLRSTECVLKFRGEETTLADLMVYSGDAFSLSHADRWQYMAYLMIPTDTLGNVARLLGYDGRWFKSDTRGLTEEEIGEQTRAVLETIWGEIDSGRPVPVAGCSDQGCAKWSVVVGYDRADLQMCHNGIGGHYRWTGIRGLNIDLDPEAYPRSWNGRLRGQIGGHIGGWLANLGFVVGEKREAPSQRDRIVTVLRRSVELFNAERRRIGNENFYFGREAYEQWEKSLRELDYPADTKKPVPQGSWHVYEMENLDYMVDLIVRGRSAAAQYLNRAAASLPDVAGNVTSAAKSYLAEVEIARRSFSEFIPPWSGNDAAVGAWLSDRQKLAAAADAVMQMLDLEKAAVNDLEKALALLEQTG